MYNFTITIIRLFFHRLGYQIYGERRVYVLNSKRIIQQGKVIEFVGPSGSGKTTNLEFFSRKNKALIFKKKKYITHYNHKLNTDETRITKSYLKKIISGDRNDYSFNKGIQSFLKKTFFLSHLLYKKKIIITDEGLYKLFLFDIVPNSNKDNLEIFSNVYFVFFYSDLEKIIDMRFNKIESNIELDNIKLHIQNYHDSMIKTMSILDSQGIDHLILDGFEDKRLNQKKIEEFVLKILETD